MHDMCMLLSNDWLLADRAGGAGDRRRVFVPPYALNKAVFIVERRGQTAQRLSQFILARS